MKKYKNIIINILVSIGFLVATFILIGRVYSLTVDYFPTESEFMNAKAEDLLGRSIYEGDDGLWGKLDAAGQLGCFHHVESGGMSNTIHSVYDIGFNTNRGVMQIYSVMDTTPRKSKTTYADGNELTVGRLAAEAMQSGNATGVQRALAEAIKAGIVVNDTAVGLEEEHVDSVNHASQAQIDLYNNYKEINKETATKEPAEKSQEVIINKEEYTIVGPFKMTFGGKGIDSVVASGAKWTSTSSKDIYWCKTISEKEKDWSNDFNKQKSGKYVLDNQEFYIAIQTSKLPDSGKYNVIIKQDEFEYSKARIVFCLNKADGVTVGQQTGFYAYDNSPSKVVGEISWSVKRNATKTLEIIKKDKKTDKEITGAKFKIYAELKNGTKGWVSGDAAGTKTYGDKADEYDAKVSIKSLKFGTYYIYETQVPEGYDLTEQEGYHKEAPGSSSLTGDWVFLGEKVLDASTKDTNGVVSYNATNVALSKLEIIKKDATKEIELTGGKFKLYAVLKNGTKGWVSGEATATKTYGETASEYASSTIIEKLKYGTYYVYETEAPEGYDITKQDGYHKAAEGSSSLTGDWAYLGSQELNVDAPDDGVFKYNATNKKIINGLEGRVWIDNPDTKANKTDNIYDSSTNDKLKEGITVNLYNGQGNLLATTKTDANGEYKFTTKNASSEEDKNIYYWDLADAYVEFMYNNKTIYTDDTKNEVKEYGYISVDPFVGTNAKINSKAQEYTVTKQKLDDNNLTGENGENPGRAVTNKDAVITDVKQLLEKNKEISEKIKNNTASEADLKDVPLACYYDNTTFKVSDINLGLLEQHDPTYNVDENLAYIKVKMKGYTYTYKYGEAAVTDSKYVPAVQEQNSSKTFTGKIYPTDIAYNAVESTATDKLQVYVVYSIDVTNTDTTYVDNMYYEQRLYLESLTNSFDTERYTLCTDENTEDKKDFALWKASGDGTATYDVNAESSVYKNGMGKNETVTSYIQFKIKEEAVQRLLQNNISATERKNAPTKATVNAYHEYLRTDNAWKHDENVRAFEGVKGLNTYPVSTENNKKYYVHKTVSKERQAADLYLKLSIGDSRKVSGKVFEDTKTSQSASEKTNLGNGMIDDGENNRASEVTVDLLNQDKSTPATLYQVKDNKAETATATVKSTGDGTFTFDGVVPGYYYIRFTYGDGTQKMMPASDVIKSNDYKSTIINTESNNAGTLIKDAIEEKDPIAKIGSTLPAKYTEEQKKLVEWYKYLNNTTYSTATDDLIQRAQADGYTYTNGKIYDKDGKEVSGYMNINAYTPMVGISIENDINNETDVKGKEDNVEEAQKPNYSGFNFGIIKNAPTELKVDKKITNVNFTTQTGTTLVSANPTDKTANYITALDKVTGGSKYAKLEIEKDLIYGSELATTYEVSIENNSAKDYIENEGTEGYGHYSKYGDKSNAHLKKITVEEVVDTMDTKYAFDSKQESASQIVTDEAGNTTESENVKIVKNDDTTENSLTITNWTPIASQEKTTTNYTVTSLVSPENDDTSYSNEAKITKIKLEKLSTLESSFDWTKAKDTTELAITPPTGGNRSNLYWIVGTIGLIVIAGGIVIIKRKLLNK